MGDRRTIVSALLLGAAVWAAHVRPANGQDSSTFSDFHVTRVHYTAPTEAPDHASAPTRFFRTRFGMRATFALGQSTDRVDLETDPIRVSFGSFTASIGAGRQISGSSDEKVLRYSSSGLNWIRNLFIKQVPSGFRLRVRATRLSIDRPEHFTIEIGDDVGQIDLRTREPSLPRAFVYGMVAARRPHAGARGAVVRAPCADGACRHTTDDKGRFTVETEPGERRLTIDGTFLATETLSHLARPVTARPGTTDVGLVSLPSVSENTSVWVSAGVQAAETVVSYPPAATPPDVSVTIAPGALVELPDGATGSRRFSASRMLKEMLPTATPAGVAAASAYVVEPAGARVTPCAGVVIRNPFSGLSDGAAVDLFTLDASGTWVAATVEGIVFDGGKRIRADGALCEISSFFVGCTAELTSVKARVTFRGAALPGVPVSVQGRWTLSTDSQHDQSNVALEAVVAGCAGNSNTLRAYAALPLRDGYLSGASAEFTTAPGGQTDLGEIALALCGDGIPEGEECDREDLGNPPATCGRLGYEAGLLTCTPTCVFDVAGCSTCGDSIASAGEECDGLDDSLCPGVCRADCSCPPVCGDRVRNRSAEACDGGDDELCPDRCDDACRCPDPAVTTTTLPPSNCPLQFELTPSARALSLTGASGFEIGYTGLGHDRDIAGGRAIAVAVTCEQAEAPCGRCNIDGLAAIDARCAAASSVICNAIDAPDQECGGGLCHAYLLPPLHNMWGGGPSCFVERLTGNVSGFIDNESGAVELEAALAGDLYFGVGPTQPCPVCKGDAAPNDGIKDGTCVGGAFGGDKCDANGIDPTFGDTSFDCLPGVAMLGTTSPVARRLTLTSAGESLPFSAPCDFPNEELACPCAVCAGDTSVACASDTDCTTAGTSGPCDRRGAGALRRPNVCDGNACADTGDGIHGVCAAGPDESFCDGVLFAHGTPFLPCLTNGDCAALDEACGGNCGECTIAARRSCFLDPIVAPAFATPTRAVLSDVLCMAPGASQGLDQVAGLAGPERVMLDVAIRRIFARSRRR